MNILFIHEVDWLKRVVYEIHTLPELLALRGHKIYFIDYESEWSRLGYSKHKEIQISRSYTNITLIRPSFIKIPIISRMSAFISHYFAINKTIKEKKIDLIILYSVPTNGLQAVILARKHGIPIIFRSIDTLQYLVKNRILRIITKQLEKIVYRNVDLILMINKRLMQYVEKLGAKSGKCRLLPLGVDTNIFNPEVKANGLYERWGLKPSDKIMLFVGTLPEFCGLEKAIYGLQFMLRKKYVSNPKLVIVGDGAYREALENLADKLGVRKHIIFTGYQSHSLIPNYINMADICLSTFTDCSVTKDIFPTKIIQYMACGKPVLATRLPGIADMLGENQGVLFFDFGLYLANIFNSDKAIAEYGCRALNYVKQTHDYKLVIKQLEVILKELASECIASKS